MGSEVLAITGSIFVCCFPDQVLVVLSIHTVTNLFASFSSSGDLTALCGGGDAS
jgi:hypothetical protein